MTVKLQLALSVKEIVEFAYTPLEFVAISIRSKCAV